jgi:hypothetical protein
MGWLSAADFLSRTPTIAPLPATDLVVSTELGFGLCLGFEVDGCIRGISFCKEEV